MGSYAEWHGLLSLPSPDLESSLSPKQSRDLPLMSNLCSYSVAIVITWSYKAGHYCAAPVGSSDSSYIIVTMATDPPDQLILHAHQIAVAISLYTV